MVSLKDPFNSQGFNRVEILVLVTLVITIIVVGLIGFLNIQKNIRDSKRKADIGVISSSLETHYNTRQNQYCRNAPIESYCHPQYPWFPNGVPIDPLYGDYLNLPKNGDKKFLICAKLESGGGNSSDSVGTPAPGGMYYCQRNQQ